MAGGGRTEFLSLAVSGLSCGPQTLELLQAGLFAPRHVGS